MTDLITVPAADSAADRPYWVALSLVPGMGPVSFARLVTRYGSARATWDAGPRILDEIPRQPPGAADALKRLRRSGAVAIARQLDRSLARLGAKCVTSIDPTYPVALAGLHVRPPVLYVAGDVAAFSRRAVAVVGTRQATGYGRSCAAEIADDLARAGVAVVSGLAIGIDGAAHVAALDAGGTTIAVLPSPLDRVYPPRHRDLARRIAASGGALLSEIPPGGAVGRPDFARRNRIIAGLALATVVVEAPDRSGALLTAAAATDLGRELYAVPGPIDSTASAGANRLIADHLATLVTSPAALLTSIGMRSESAPVGVSSLSDAEGLVLAGILRRAGSVEELIARTRLPTGTVASVLTLLEARGLVTSYGGATFHPTLVARRIGRLR